MAARMPKAQRAPMVAPQSIDVLIFGLKNFDPASAAQEYPWADRFVMGMPLAPWQRKFKWSEAQCERFIGSLWTGVSPGTYLVTEAQFGPGENGTGLLHAPLSNMVIDGQQRLTAIEHYLTDKLSVPDFDGRPTLWSEVDIVDRRRFSNTIFSRGEIRDTDEVGLREFYDLLNFGGIAHEEHERASSPVGKQRPR